MQPLYIMLVASSLARVDSATEAASSNAVAHHYLATVHSLAGNEDTILPEKLLKSNGTAADDGVRTIGGADTVAQKMMALWPKMQGKSWSGSFSKLSKDVPATQDGVIAILEHAKMKNLVRLYPNKDLITEFVTMLEHDHLALALALARAKTSPNTDVKEIAELLSKQHFELLRKDVKTNAGMFECLELDKTKAEEYLNFDLKISALEGFIASRRAEAVTDKGKLKIRASGDTIASRQTETTTEKDELIETLTEGFGGLNELLRVIDGARLSGNMNALSTARRLSQKMHVDWDNRMISPADVVVLLKLIDGPIAWTGEKLSTLSAYISYKSDVLHATTQHLFDVLYEGFEKFFRSDKELAAMLVRMMPTSTDLLRLLFARWMKIDKFTPDNVFGKRLQKLDREDADQLQKKFGKFYEAELAKKEKPMPTGQLQARKMYQHTPVG
ncbi:unnamed protein product [Hyaloperonospora brassicae]|uniref:RxLR effector candidate protein n=1 Tax=Hyaloperonospora brassicae TaxID=162125 RepID=A0AAV0TDR9_HYABA|nr:unnamed protein product [Hyaloperonospora brassicae]